MKANINLYWILTVFLALVTVAYVVWSLVDPLQGSIEWVGTFAIALCALLVAFIGFYLSRVYKAQGGELPEDMLDANIDDGDPELGFFSP